MPITTQRNGKTITIQDTERTVTECYTRVVGYFRPIDFWNIGKKSENKERKWYRLTPAIHQHLFSENANDMAGTPA